jgi:hypothetical protein
MARPHHRRRRGARHRRMRSLGVGKQAFQRIANASPIAELGKGLHKRGVDLDSARALVKEFEVQLTSCFQHLARVAQFILRILAGWGISRIVAANRYSRTTVTVAAGRWFCVNGHVLISFTDSSIRSA